MKAIGQFSQGIAAYDAGRYTRTVMRVNSRNTLDASVGEQELIRRNARSAMGGQLVAQGNSGFQMGTGSALDALRESTINRELDLALSRSAAKSKSDAFLQQGQLAYAQGKAAMAGGILSGAATIAEQVAGAVAGGGYGGAGGAPSAAANSGGYELGGGTAAYFNANPMGGTL